MALLLAGASNKGAKSLCRPLHAGWGVIRPLSLNITTQAVILSRRGRVLYLTLGSDTTIGGVAHKLLWDRIQHPSGLLADRLGKSLPSTVLAAVLQYHSDHTAFCVQHPGAAQHCGSAAS